MLGSGIIVLSAPAVEDAGFWAILSYLAAGSFCLLIAPVILQLSSGLPKAGRNYPSILRLFGPYQDSIGGQGSWLALSVAAGYFVLSGLLSVQYPEVGWRTESRAASGLGCAGDPLMSIVCRKPAAVELTTRAPS
jgi:amino acid transporter